MTTLLSAETTYTIRSGDTIYSIARSYNLSTQAILAANKIKNPTAIGIGTSIIIPQTAPASTPTEHTVQKGDTYYSIARNHNLSVTALLALNQRSSEQVLRVGDSLRLTSQRAANTPRATGNSAQSIRTTRVSAAQVAPTDGNGVWPHNGMRKSVQGKFPAVVIDANQGDIVRAVSGGRVVHIDSNGAFGQVVFVQSQTGHIYIYGGNEESLVAVGDRVTAGAFVGRVGSERIGADSSQVYFSVWYRNTFIDPRSAPRG